MEILSDPNLSDAVARSQASCSSIQDGQEPSIKKNLLMFLQKEIGPTCGTATLSNRTPIQQLQAEVEAYNHRYSTSLGI